jgi:hypothetical protein
MTGMKMIAATDSVAVEPSMTQRYLRVLNDVTDTVSH